MLVSVVSRRLLGFAAQRFEPSPANDSRQPGYSRLGNRVAYLMSRPERCHAERSWSAAKRNSSEVEASLPQNNCAGQGFVASLGRQSRNKKRPQPKSRPFFLIRG